MNYYLFDSFGNLILKDNNQYIQINIDCNNLINGIYYLMIFSNNEIKYIKLLIID
jgi:hypothetical protein